MIEGVQICSVIFLLRAYRLLGLIREVRQWDMIFTTWNRLSQPFLGMMISLYTVYYLYAWVGILAFSNSITLVSKQTEMTIPQLYYLMNFNDFGSSLITLFCQMVVNNWFITCDMYTYVTGSNWVVLFFVSFWVIQVNVMLNLVIAFVMEIYNTINEDLEAEYNRRDYVYKLQ